MENLSVFTSPLSVLRSVEGMFNVSVKGTFNVSETIHYTTLETLVRAQNIKIMYWRISVQVAPAAKSKSTTYTILLAGSEMGNREFRIDVNGVNMKEKKLYKQLFQLRQEEVDENNEKKQKNRQFD